VRFQVSKVTHPFQNGVDVELGKAC